MTSWAAHVAARNDATRAAGRWRSIRSLDGGAPSTTVSRTGESVLGFASNDYLGLSQHPAVVAAAHEALDRDGAGSGAARLIVGSRPVHDQLEAALAEWTGREAALLFPTGFQANLGVLGSLAAAAPGCVILSDELNHASIIDGCRAARADVEVYRHGDVAHAAELLARHAGRPTIVVTDAVFSMDGDLAPLSALAETCRDHDALLVVDEAHAVLGPAAPEDALVVGTLSKTLGSVGGFVAGPRSVIDLCTNTARSFIFTTANSPADAAAALAALHVLRSEEGAALIARLRANVDELVPAHPSPVVAVLLGSEQRALEVSAALLERGLLVPAIRPPTVAPGTCRLRIAVSAQHEPAQLGLLKGTLAELGVHDLGVLT
jgi:8-amino-7-oxononanoate synthase